ncbi:MAG TPA: hypothetical protein VHF58_09695 [Solirubrobacterales bacterium]|nr:hypothetical protein [Solirubrobacterales bacterium]
MSCERLREVGAELALGIADGEERARALEHLAECPACRAHVERLAAVADELALLAPAADPPPGFEGRASAAMRPTPSRRRRVGRAIATPALAALTAGLIGAAAVWLALDDDRELADSYRDALAVADGEYFTAAPLERPGGATSGYVYGYQGRASWVLAVVFDGVDPGDYELEVVTAAGERLPLRRLAVDGEGRGSTGGVTPVDYHDLAEVRLLDRAGREVADSELDG